MNGKNLPQNRTDVAGKNIVSRWDVRIIVFVFTLLTGLLDWPVVGVRQVQAEVSADATAKVAKVLVFPLSGTVAGAGAWMGEGVAISLGEQLYGSDWRSFSRRERDNLLMTNDLPVGVPLSQGSMVYVAENAGVPWLVIGQLAGDEKNLRLSARLWHIRTLRQGSELTVTGAMTNLPQMENELAWMLYADIVVGHPISREEFRQRQRKAPAAAWDDYLQSLSATGEDRRQHLLEKALKIWPDFAQARFQLGQIYYRKRDYVRAGPLLAAGRQIAGEAAGSEFMLATCHLQSGAIELAIQEYRRMLERKRRPEDLNNLALAYIRTGDNIAAAAALDEARKLAPDSADLVINLAIARYLAGNAPAALALVEKELQTHHDNGMFYALLSFLLKQAGKDDGNDARAATAAATAVRLGVKADRLVKREPRDWLVVMTELAQ